MEKSCCSYVDCFVASIVNNSDLCCRLPIYSVIVNKYCWSIYPATGSLFFSGANPGIYLGGANLGPQSKVKGESRIEGAKRPSIEGRSPRRGREAPENWGRSPNRERSPRKSGGRGLGRGLGEPLPRKFLKKSNFKPFILVHIWSNYLKWLTKWFKCPHSWKIISNYWMWRNY